MSRHSQGSTNHDLRRTFSQLSAMGNIIPLEVREALLAHTKKGIVGTYDQYQYVDEKRTALSLRASGLSRDPCQPDWKPGNFQLK